ncbi:hypothetical protein QCA50_004196 [Cerrena zonata]|uniref:BSD domain-containing protein n=1 Tax=Cerrena zonata TaxID=2478898 RepID=A0AAW0GSP8_9APHY
MRRVTTSRSRHPKQVALVEREKFKTELTNIIGRNRVSTTTTTSTPNRPPGTPLIPGTPATPSHVQTPRPVTAISRAASSSRAPSVASDSRGPGTPIGDPTTDFRLRKKVLVSTPELAQLHRELVMTGQISENEFWEGREHLLLAQAAAESQKRGKPGQLVDPRPQTVDGEVKIVITPQLVHDIFEEYPVVAKAYNDNVPNKLSESEFWIRYFQSKLFNAHRASIRSSATQHVVKDDPIFDKYLEKDDDELEPRRQREEGVDMFIDLAATAVDHGDTGNEKDVTMQAGKQRAVLPLIRKFNEHSGRLLNSSLGEQPAKRRRVDSGNEARYSQLDLEDLHTNDSSEGILLDMQDRRKYFEGRSTNLQPVEKLNVKAVVQEANTNIKGWETRLSQLKIERKAGDAALVAMTQNVVARLEVTKRKSDLPEGIFRQMTTCQTAANEFLRQFWLAIYPPPLEVPTASSSNPAQRTAKAAKMAWILGEDA